MKIPAGVNSRKINIIEAGEKPAGSGTGFPVKGGSSRKVRGMAGKKRADNLFYAAMTFIPLALLAFGQIVNVNSILLAFKAYNDDGTISFVGFKNFADVLNTFIHDSEYYMCLYRSVVVYLTTLVVTTVVPILISYYMFKRCRGHGLFKVIMFLPSVVSGVVLVMIYKFLIDLVYPKMMFRWFGKEVFGILSDKETKFGAVLFYKLWFSLGGGMLIQLAAMNSVDKNVIEAGKLDGLSYLGEFWHVVLPHCYTVISLGFITGIVTLFTDDFGLYAFYGPAAPVEVRTLGYYFLMRTKSATELRYPFLSAWGLLESAIVIPLTMFARWAIYKYGPQEE